VPFFIFSMKIKKDIENTVREMRRFYDANGVPRPRAGRRDYRRWDRHREYRTMLREQPYTDIPSGRTLTEL